MCLAGMLAVTSCNDFLDTDSPSNTDAKFVFSTTETSRAALDGAYESWRQAAQNQVFGDGLFYAADVAGSDIERHPEKWTAQPARHYPESFYQNGTYTSSYNLTGYMKDDENGPYAMLFAVISQANISIQSIKNVDGFNDVLATGQPSTMGQIYGEAIALWGTAYRELLRYYGDVPYITGDADEQAGLVSRDYIYDKVLEKLIEAAPVMYDLGSIPGVSGKNYFSKTYVNGLIGRMALEAGGYQTRRGDIKPINGKGEALTIEQMGTVNQGAAYGRRSDWQSLYTIARDHFKEVITNPGTAKFLESDSRANPNPYQLFFQQLHEDDNSFADESIYEYAMSQGEKLNDARPYSFGRPTTGGSKNNYPCKNYGQGRINPAFYYGMFDPADMRRDVSCTVTATNGAKGTELLLPFKPGSQGKGGGISFNKWDENRQTTVWTANQRKSGINGPYMRMSEIYLGYAEACAALGDDGEAMTYLTKIRDRAFGGAGKGNVAAYVATKADLVEAIVDERGFEYAGEGDRRQVLLRTGLMAKKVKAIKDLTTTMINGLKNDGFYQFENGNVISMYVWTKYVDGKALNGARLTTQCPAGQENDPVLYPSWRGVNNDWSKYGLELPSNYAPNLAIKGLFTTVLPTKLTVTYTLNDVEKEAQGKSTESFDITSGITFDKITELLTLTEEQKAKYTKVTVKDEDGYEPQAWGIDIVNNADEYSTYMFYDWDYTSAPIYLWPFTPNVLANGGFQNGYGFKNN